HGQPGWFPHRRSDSSRHSQRPPAIRHHLARDRARAGGLLSRISLGERAADHRRPDQGQDMIANDPYGELERRFARLSAVNRACAILNWDRSTMMPEGASDDRADQLATLGVIAHGMISAPDMPELLGLAEAGGGLDP